MKKALLFFSGLALGLYMLFTALSCVDDIDQPIEKESEPKQEVLFIHNLIGYNKDKVQSLAGINSYLRVNDVISKFGYTNKYEALDNTLKKEVQVERYKAKVLVFHNNEDIEQVSISFNNLDDNVHTPAFSNLHSSIKREIELSGATPSQYYEIEGTNGKPLITTARYVDMKNILDFQYGYCSEKRQENFITISITPTRKKRFSKDEQN